MQPRQENLTKRELVKESMSTGRETAHGILHVLVLSHSTSLEMFVIENIEHVLISFSKDDAKLEGRALNDKSQDSRRSQQARTMSQRRSRLNGDIAMLRWSGLCNQMQRPREKSGKVLRSVNSCVSCWSVHLWQE